MLKVEGDNWWLGLHTYENDGRFRWSDHSVLNYVSWALGRPHPVSRDRRCVHLSATKGKESRDKRPQETKSDAVHMRELVFFTPEQRSGLIRSVTLTCPTSVRE